MTRRFPTAQAMAWLAAAALLVLFALAAPVNHDEGQYLGAALLTRGGRPFVDFLYLQTPLQPYLSAPLLAMFPGKGFLALRCATALLGALLLWIVYQAARTAGASARAAAAAALLLGTTRAFLFSAAVVRNDMLPAVFAALAMLLLLDSGRGWRAGLAGLALGLAASTKVSYLLPLAAAGGFLLFELRRGDERKAALGSVAAFSAGALAGLLPTLLSWLRAPEAFGYGVFEYAETAPYLWYGANGFGDRLGLVAKLGDSLSVMALGAGLVAMVAVAVDATRQRRDPANRRSRHLLEWLSIGGLVAALLPTPTWRQYFLPLLIPLFVRLAIIDWPAGRRRTVLVLLLALSALAGPLPRARSLADALRSGQWPLAAAEREAHWVGAVIGRPGSIATLSPHAMIDSGSALDPRFAMGPFAYRTADAIDDQRQRRLRIVSPRTLAAELDRIPPAAILTGYESGQNLDRRGLDRMLVDYAVRHDYRRFRSPFGAATLYVAPVRPGR